MDLVTHRRSLSLSIFVLIVRQHYHGVCLLDAQQQNQTPPSVRAIGLADQWDQESVLTTQEVHDRSLYGNDDQADIA